ncbi:hypothetical protein PGIGA_G00075370 [Pangasianodon gigas]|uniref:Uncharacterized protein n=1 Tax=Pangasianodon gigas TaxID=30993 RepID=A0ACC5X8Z4_PANGG|nr:hypothetical protein [Pangasianodon gigas]
MSIKLLCGVSPCVCPNLCALMSVKLMGIGARGLCQDDSQLQLSTGGFLFLLSFHFCHTDNTKTQHHFPLAGNNMPYCSHHGI